VKILLDENLPDSLLVALQKVGHEVDSINRLHLKGIDNGTLYRQVAQKYDLCFTRDVGFAHNVRQIHQRSKVKVLLVVIPQQRVGPFVEEFVNAFRVTDWSKYTEVLTGRNSKGLIWESTIGFCR